MYHWPATPARRRGAKGLRSVLWLLLAIALWPWPGRLHADDARLVFAPASAQVQVGAEAEVQVRLEDISALYGLDLRLRFDPALIEIVDVDGGVDSVQVIEGTFPFPDFLVRNEADNSAGTIWYAVAQIYPREPASGSGTIMTIRLRGRAAGTSFFDVDVATFVDMDALELSVATSVGEVVVLSAGGASAATPTRTSTPTLTPLPAVEGANPTLPAQPTSTRTPLPTLTLAVTSTPGTPGAPTATAAASPGYPSPVQATLTPSLTPTAGPSPTPGQAPTVEAYPGLSTPAFEEQLTPAEPGSATGTPAQTGEPEGYPGPGEPTPIDAQEVAGAGPAAPALRITMPALAALPTRAPASPPVKPLVAREVFICFVALLAIFTLALGLYLWRRERWRARRS